MQLDIRSECYQRDPYGCFRQFRMQAPVCRIQPYGYWAIFKYNDVQWVLKQDNLFTSVLTEHELDEHDPQFLFYARSLLGMDNPRHAKLRQRVAQAFKPSLIKPLEKEIKTICTNLVASIPPEPIDFIKAFSMPLPLIMIAKLLGLDVDKIQDYKKWIDWLLSWRNQTTSNGVTDDTRNMHHYFNQIIAHKRQFPDNDLISSLLEQDLTHAEVLALIRLLLVAGTDTTTNLLNHALIALLENPEQLKQIRTNPSKIPECINETLRFNSPTISLMRKATQDIHLSGIFIQKGEIVLPIVASANHDEAHFDNPHVFDINRENKQHLALGSGIHYCLGTHLAKLQIKIALETLFSGFESAALVQHPLQYLPSFFFRSICKLPVILLNE